MAGQKSAATCEISKRATSSRATAPAEPNLKLLSATSSGIAMYEPHPCKFAVHTSAPTQTWIAEDNLRPSWLLEERRTKGVRKA